MNRVYFVRHAKPDFSVHDDLIRPLTEEGIRDSKKLTPFFLDKNISKIYSSPYKRSVDTIRDIAENLGMEIIVLEDFRERKISDQWIEDFNGFAQSQWSDFNHRLPSGESLAQVQDRNIKQLHKILLENQDQTIIIGTHGTALSTIINYYDPKFSYAEFAQIRGIMPWVVYMEFDKCELVSIHLSANKL